MNFKTRYSKPTEFPRGIIDNFEPSQTQQHFANDVNINCIMEKYTKTGILGDPSIKSTRQALFGDFSQQTTYAEAFDAVNRAQEEFLSLPAKIRDRFENSPQQLINFVGDEKNRAEAIALGLIELSPEQTKEPVKTGSTVPTT